MATAGLAFQFEHALVRDTVEASIAPLARKRGHLAVAHAIEAAHPTDRRPVLAELARHFAAAVPIATIDSAVEYGRLAAAQAIRTAAYDEASSHLGTVLALDPPDLPRARALVELAQVQLWTGHYAPSRESSRTAFTLASGAGAADVAAEAALQFELATHFPGLHGEPAVVLLRRAIELVGEERTPLRVRLHASLGRALAIDGRRDVATGVIEVAVADAREIGDTVALLFGLEATITSADDPATILAAARELEALARGRDELWGIAYGSANQSRAQIALGDLADAHARARPVPHRVRDGSLRPVPVDGGASRDHPRHRRR